MTPPRARGRALLALLPLLAAAACAGPRMEAPEDGREATSLLGLPLYSIPSSDAAKRDRLEADIAAARAAYAADPTEDHAIWVGRRLGYAGLYREAIAAYSDGLRRYPDSHRLLRHRGHRFITIREFDHAIRDLSRAWSLVKDGPDAVEPDGQPTIVNSAVVPPRGTDKTSILYHLGLAHFLKGDFARAVEVFSRRRELPDLNDDNIVSSMHWEYVALRRLGRDDEAAELVRPIREGVVGKDVRENQSYFTLVRLYAGLITPAQAERGADGPAAPAPASVGVRYGLAIRRLYEDRDEVAARAALGAIIADKPEQNWPGFGFIAAEADLARLTRHPGAR